MALTNKMKMQIESLSVLTEKMFQWETCSETELDKLFKELEKMPRKEYSCYYEPYFTNELVEKILPVAKKYPDNTSILINLVSTLGNMLCRYNLEYKKEVFELFITLSKIKKTDYYVSLFLTRFPQFADWEGKWEYLLSIPQIAPRQKSKDNFRVEIKYLLDVKTDIPAVYKVKIKDLLVSFLLENQGEYSQKEYKELIVRLETY